MSAPRHVTVLGGGLTGLTAAYRLSKASPSTNISLIDASKRVGGWVDSSKHAVGFKGKNGELVEGEVVLEGGPRTIRPRGSRGAPKMLKLIHDLGLWDKIIPVSKTHPAATSRFLLDTAAAPKSLVRLPSSLASMLKPQHPMLKGLLLNAGLEPLRKRRRQSGAVDEVMDESVDSFFRRRLGPRIADNLASAMVHGIYAADSRRLSVRSAFPSLWDSEQSHGSVLLGSMFGKGKSGAEKWDWEVLEGLGKREEAESWSIYGLQGGTGALTDALQREFLASEAGARREIIAGEKVDRLEPGPEQIQVKAGSSTLSTDHIISALPALAISNLVPPAAATLAKTQYTTVGVVNLVFPLPPSSVHPAGFGYLVPRSSPSLNPAGILGVIFDSTALPGNDSASLDGQVTKLTVMMGGPWWSSYIDNPIVPTGAEELTRPALDHVRSVFPVLEKVEPLVVLPRLQKDCIPTYTPGHGANLGRLHQTLQKDEQWAGKVSLVGNGYGGVGVNDCVLSAEEVVAGLEAGSRPTGLEAWAQWK